MNLCSVFSRSSVKNVLKTSLLQIEVYISTMLRCNLNASFYFSRQPLVIIGLTRMKTNGCQEYKNIYLQ